MGLSFFVSKYKGQGERDQISFEISEMSDISANPHITDISTIRPESVTSSITTIENSKSRSGGQQNPINTQGGECTDQHIPAIDVQIT